MFFILLKYLLSYIITNILYNFIYADNNFARQHSDFISNYRLDIENLYLFFIF